MHYVAKSSSHLPSSLLKARESWESVLYAQCHTLLEDSLTIHFPPKFHFRKSLAESKF